MKVVTIEFHKNYAELIALNSTKSDILIIHYLTVPHSTLGHYLWYNLSLAKHLVGFELETFQYVINILYH